MELTVTDDFGCVGESIVDITLHFQAPSSYEVLGDNSISALAIIPCFLYQNSIPLTIGQHGDQNDNITVQEENTYDVTVTNSDGCSASTSFDLIIFCISLNCLMTKVQLSVLVIPLHSTLQMVL